MMKQTTAGVLGMMLLTSTSGDALETVREAMGGRYTSWTRDSNGRIRGTEIRYDGALAAPMKRFVETSYNWWDGPGDPPADFVTAQGRVQKWGENLNSGYTWYRTWAGEYSKFDLEASGYEQGSFAMSYLHGTFENRDDAGSFKEHGFVNYEILNDSSIAYFVRVDSDWHWTAWKNHSTWEMFRSLPGRIGGRFLRPRAEYGRLEDWHSIIQVD